MELVTTMNEFERSMNDHLKSAEFTKGRLYPVADLDRLRHACLASDYQLTLLQAEAAAVEVIGQPC